MTEVVTISVPPDTVTVTGAGTTVDVTPPPDVTITVAVPPPIPGPTGPAGPAGPEGPQGPQGIPGAGGVASVNDMTGTVTLTASSFGLAVPVTVPVQMPSATWSITHDFPYSPNVVTFDPAGGEIVGDITFPDGQTVVISWAGAQTGSVELS
jgi:hypothetical protein